MGGRDSPRPSIPQADETWTTVGRGPRNVNVRVDPKKFQNIKVLEHFITVYILWDSWLRGKITSKVSKRICFGG